ncbi:hypothetical protein JZ751_002602 [Albula glossodonta]|uniref:Synaptotagmin-like protein 1 n=1 Tax=Albula glossodonta TaxID=121402 RepID=A0A8T2N7B9_9TELE|nr:hypothetical protein JZ751_002602 [Albula glossodonta]
MRSHSEVPSDLDLSFLSAEEESAIQKVLQRDENLRKQETGRIRQLRLSIDDPSQLKVMTGEWFEDLRSRRHGRQEDATDVVRSSIRRKKAPAPRTNPFTAEREAELSDEKPGSDDQPVERPGEVTITGTQIHASLREEGDTTEEITLDNDGCANRKEEPATDEDKGSPQLMALTPTERNPCHGSADISSVDVLGWTYPHYRSNEALPSPGKNMDAFVPPSQESSCMILTKHIGSQSSNQKPICGSKAEDAVIEVQLSPHESLRPAPENEAVECPKTTGIHESGSELSFPLDSQEEGVREDTTCSQVEVKDSDPETEQKGIEVTLGTSESMCAPQKHETTQRSEEVFRVELGESDHAGGGISPGFDVVTPISVHVPSESPSKQLPEVHTQMESTSCEETDKEDLKGNYMVIAGGMSEIMSLPQPSLTVKTESSGSGTELGSLEGDHQPAVGEAELQPVKDKASMTETPNAPISKSVLVSAENLINRYTSKDQPEQEVKQESPDPSVPKIVVIPTDFSVPEDTEGCEGQAVGSKVLPPGDLALPTPGSYLAHSWEDADLDSDDDCSSVSSMGSDVLGRRGFSGSALSLSERSSSMLSVYSDAGDFGNLVVQGAVEFSLRYSSAGELHITVEQCQDLAFANARKQRTDPYVKTYLYPDKSRQSKRKTSIKKRTVNPVYGELLKYKLKKEDLQQRTLNLSVWHNDSRGRNVFLGQVEIDLKTWDWGHEALTWYNLLPKNAEALEAPEGHGRLTVALKFVPPISIGGSKPSSGEIHVWLREARGLQRLKPQGVDSFVKCYMLPDTSKKSRQKTRVVKKSQQPIYNHTMVYDGFRSGEVREACCELSVWDHNTLSNQFLGGVRLSLGKGESYGKKVDWMDSSDKEVELWERMLSNPNVWVEEEVPLRPSMTPRK